MLPFFRQLTLRQGLIWIVLLALFPVVVVSVIQGFATFENTRNLATSRLSANARAIAGRERDAFVIAQHLLMTLAANRDVIEMSDRCDDALGAGLQGYRPIVNFARTDSTGLVRCSVLPHDQPVNLADENWWRKGIESQRLTLFKTPIFGEISKRNLLMLMLPLKDRASRQDGALIAGIDIDGLQQLLIAAPEGQTGNLAIVTADGKVVTQGERPLGFTPDMGGPGERVRVSASTTGQQWMYSIVTLYSDDLFVVYAEPKDRLMASAVSQVRASIFLPVISILLASLAIWLGTNRLVVRWLKDLGNVANRFAKGEYIGEGDRFGDAPKEVAQLSADLHSMAEAMDKRSRDLIVALDAKTELTREVHHRVKNNLQIITSLLTLQAGRVREQGAKDVLGQTRARISALALIHRLLYEQDTENTQGHVLIKDLVDELCVQLRIANRGVSGVDLRCLAQPVPVHVDLAVPLALFVVEAVTNAYRHAFGPDRTGFIRVEFDSEGDEARLTIRDNGDGFDIDQAPGQMGAELMNAFTAQVSGRLDIDTGIGNGTTVNLTFPLKRNSAAT